MSKARLAVQDSLTGLQISYNILNLPQTVTQGEAVKATYGWFADGSKYSVQDAQGNGYHYIGSLIYSSTAGTTALESTDFSGGRIVLSGNTQTIHYHHRDHLGSVRAITDNAGAVIEQNAYYPFGGRHTFGQTYAQTASNRYKFNGKELQTIGNLSLLDYGARMYDTKTARWLVQDPLAEKYYPFSAYNYCVNNPVMLVDPDGKEIRIGKLLDNLVNFFTQNNFKEKVTNDLHTIASVNEELYSTLKSLHESDIVFYIVETDEGNKFERAYDNEILKQGIISYNINNRIGYDGKDRDPIAALAHELGHAINALEEKSIDYDKEKARHGEPKNVDKGNANEKRSIDFENFLRNYLNINERSYDYYKHKKNN